MDTASRDTATATVHLIRAPVDETVEVLRTMVSFAGGSGGSGGSGGGGDGDDDDDTDDDGDGDGNGDDGALARSDANGNKNANARWPRRPDRAARLYALWVLALRVVVESGLAVYDELRDTHFDDPVFFVGGEKKLTNTKTPPPLLSAARARTRRCSTWSQWRPLGPPRP
jgi:hypothetical protein